MFLIANNRRELEFQINKLNDKVKRFKKLAIKNKSNRQRIHTSDIHYQRWNNFKYCLWLRILKSTIDISGSLNPEVNQRIRLGWVAFDRHSIILR